MEASTEKKSKKVSLIHVMANAIQYVNHCLLSSAPGLSIALKDMYAGYTIPIRSQMIYDPQSENTMNMQKKISPSTRYPDGTYVLSDAFLIHGIPSKWSVTRCTNSST